jgi:hypothetical protein
MELVIYTDAMIKTDVLKREKGWLIGDIGDVSDGQNDTPQQK